MISHTRPAVLEAAEEYKDKPDTVREKILLRTSGKDFLSASPLTLATLSDTQTSEDLMSYAQSFSLAAREIFEHFHFEEFVQQLASPNIR